jgi:16S rRNA (cytidine1402-2'-O)-methyltransferase
MPGTLFVVATPIGNLEDLTFRALRTLREADVIAAEDTRRTAKLLAHYDVRRPVLSLREHNEARETPRLIARLQAGQRVALVSDAGTPTVSDPGARLIRTARQEGVPVVPIPGASAVVAALSASGFPADQFVFLGFPPASGQARQEWIDVLAHESRTVVFFESPHRIARTLQQLAASLVDRPILLAREISKINEELVLWPMASLVEKGEFTIVVSGRDPALSSTVANDAQLAAIVGCLTDNTRLDASEAQAVTAGAFRVTISQVRKAVKHARYARKRAEPAGEP